MARANGTAQGWTYDAAGRLSGMTDDADGTSYDRSVTFGYNPAGQIVSRTEANDTYAFTALANQNVTDTHNGLNQVTATGSTGVTHDARGNTDAIGSASYTYDSQNRLTSGPGATLSYDPLGRLYQVTTSTGVRRYVYDGLQAMIVQDVPNSGPGSVDYVVSGDTLNTPLLSYTSAGRVYHHADERGSIVAHSGDSGAVTAVNRYDEYGQPQGGSVSGRFGYTGQVWLPELGMYDYHMRVYNPATDRGGGRFMQTDRIGYRAGMNLYAGMSGDPVNLVDPIGLCTQMASVVEVWDPETDKYYPPKITDTWWEDCEGKELGGEGSDIVVTGSRPPVEPDDDEIIVTGSLLHRTSQEPPALPWFRLPAYPRRPQCTAAGHLCLEYNPLTPRVRAECRSLEEICNSVADQRSRTFNDNGSDVYEVCVGPACFRIFGRGHIVPFLNPRLSPFRGN